MTPVLEGPAATTGADMGRGRHRADPAVAVATLTGVMLAGGASLAPGIADAAAPPAAEPCRIGTVFYTPPPAAKPTPDVALGAAQQCHDAIRGNILTAGDLNRYGLVRVPSRAPSRPATTAATPAPPKTTTATTTPPTTTTTPPKVTTPTPTTTTTSSTPPPAESNDGGPGGGAPVGNDQQPLPVGSPPPSDPAVRVAAPAVPAPPPGPALASPARTVTPLGPLPPAAPGAPPAEGLIIGTAPSADPVPGEPLVIGGVTPASYLDPLGAPAFADVPGEASVLRTLGDDASGVTTSSRVSVLGLDGLHRSGGIPAVLGVIIMSGLGGFALRHRILSRIRAATPAGGPDPDLDGPTTPWFEDGTPAEAPPTWSGSE